MTGMVEEGFGLVVGAIVVLTFEDGGLVDAPVAVVGVLVFVVVVKINICLTV